MKFFPSAEHIEKVANDEFETIVDEGFMESFNKFAKARHIDATVFLDLAKISFRVGFKKGFIAYLSFEDTGIINGGSNDRPN